VVLSASAFDQRTASELGATQITAVETVDVESSEGGKREAEVLALKEAGRLLAVYFGPRILASGR
jgi:16S rRNA U1498 N3-methylase RsmE